MTTSYVFVAGYTKGGIATTPSSAPTVTIVDSNNNVLVAGATATTALSNLTGVYLYSYSGSDNLICFAFFHTSDISMDQQDLASYTPAQIYANSITEVAIKTQTDKLAFTVTNQVDANVLDWKSATAPAMTGDAYAVANGRLPSALTVNGNMKSSLMEIISTALTETLHQLSNGFVKFFDKASPTGTINSLPDAIPGANLGLPTTDGTIINQTVNVGKWLGVVPATLTATGKYIQTAILRWLSDDAAGTPSTLTTDGNIKADTLRVGGTVQTSRDLGLSLPAFAPDAAGGLPTVAVDGLKLNKTVDLTAGQTIAATIADKTGYSLSVAGILAIWNQLTADVGIVASTFGKKFADWILGTDNKALISIDAQDLSTTLDVNAKKLGGAIPNNLAAGAAMDLVDTLKNKVGASGYDRTTDSLEAIGDNPNPAGVATMVADYARRTGDYNTVVPDNTDIGTILTAIQNGTYGLSALLTSIGTRMATFTYTAPDNADIVAIKNDVENVAYGLHALLNEINAISTGQISASAIWNYLLTTIGTTGSIGELIKDNLDAKVSDIISTTSQTSTSSTSANNYYINNAVTISIVFKDKSGNPIDPTTVTLQVKDPTSTINSYTFGVGSQIVKDSPGNYHSDIDGDIAGSWVYVWDGSGNVLISGAGSFLIVDPLVPQIQVPLF